MSTVPPFRQPRDPPNLLVVGAGGIGCEVVKALILAGFMNVTVIDFDTVSLSNLSRQFFYSDDDIGTEKAAALARNAKRLCPQLNIQGLFMDVLSDDFDFQFVMNFDFVFSAVDNVSARAKVNKICLFTRTLVVDCGSSGKYGQSVPVYPFRTACYECSPAVAPSGPKITCTIRSTPENYEHCAAWAFHLFDSVYQHNESTDVINIDEGSSIFQVAFIDKVNEARENAGMWKNRTPPDPIDLIVEPSAEPMRTTTGVWSDIESAAVFKYVSEVLKPPQKFDKDNREHLAFVTAAANLRAKSYHIERRASMFEAKGLVSVVEPALATTNSALSGVAVEQMRRMLKGDESVKSVWLSSDLKGPKLTATFPEKPNLSCPNCGHDVWEVHCDYTKTRCSEIAKATGVSAPSISKGGTIIFDADDEDNDKLIADAGVKDGDLLTISDLDGDDDAVITVVVRHAAENTAELLRKVVKPKVPKFDPKDWEGSDVEIID